MSSSRQKSRRSPASDSRSASKASAWICLLLAVLTLGLFWRTTGFDFVSYDDPVYFSDNTHVSRGLTVEGIGWALRATEAANWHPMTWISLMADVQFSGPGPA